MLTKRIIPCLDVKNGRVVKGKNFLSLKDAGEPVELARRYYEEGADEIVFLDITATNEQRKTMAEVVRKVSKSIFIPLTVGGGIRSIGNIRDMLNAGADKVAINTAAIKDPGIITKASKVFGSQCIVIAIDTKRAGDSWKVFINAGTKDAGIDAIEWAKEAERLGAGEILLTSMDCDGTKSGYDIELTKKIAKSVNIPVIASGGAGDEKDIEDVLTKGEADAALAASIFHYGRSSVMQLKSRLAEKDIRVRTC